MEEKKQSRPRDERGRFIKKADAEAALEKELTNQEYLRTYNLVADGEEPSEEKVREEDIIKEFVTRAVVALGAFIVLLLAMWLLQGCSSQEKATYIPVVRTIEVQTIVRDTIIETELVEYYSERETRDTASYLTNPFAYSQATVTNGTLTHSLGIHPDATVKRPVQIVERVVRDSVPYAVPVPGPTEYVEIGPSPFERALMGIGAITLVLAAAWAALRLKRFFTQA